MKNNKVAVAIFSGLFSLMALPNISVAQSRDVILFGNNSAVVNRGGALTQIGTPGGVLTPLKGFAKDLPLVTVLRQITPNGWIVKKAENDNLNVEMPISWEGGSSWIETLGKIVNNYPVSANINWNTREITVMSANNSSMNKKMIFELEQRQSSIGLVAGASEQPLDRVQAPPAPPPVESWTLNSAKSLKENVVEWGKRAGYKVVWSAEDYPVDEKRVLTGAFDQETGPIRQLSIDYGPSSRVQKPLAFQFYQMGVLAVENYSFEQSGFPQYSSKK